MLATANENSEPLVSTAPLSKVIGEPTLTSALRGRDTVIPCCLLLVQLQLALNPPIRLKVCSLNALTHVRGAELASLTDRSNWITKLDKSLENNTSNTLGALSRYVNEKSVEVDSKFPDSWPSKLSLTVTLHGTAASGS